MRLQFSENCIYAFAAIASELILSQKSDWCLKSTLTSQEPRHSMISSSFTDLI